MKWTESTTYNSTFAIGGVSCCPDTSMVAESFVLRINIGGKNPAHRKSAKRCHSLRNAPGRNGNGLKKRNFNEQKSIGFSTQTLTEKLCGFLSKFAESEPDRNLKTSRKTEQNADNHSCGIEKQNGTEQVCGKNCPLER